MIGRGSLNRLREQLDALTAGDDRPGCSNCYPPRVVEIRSGDPSPEPLPCLSPDRCPGGVRVIVVEHMEPTDADAIEVPA